MERILSYTLKRKLGEGGFATVWYGLNHIGKAAAIKVLSPDLRHIPEVVERFEQEARIMALLEHDHIRQVYDYDRDNLAIVMEYLEGQDLSAWLASHGPADAATLRTWLAQALDGMDYAHGQGVVHRDIKPSNLFLTSRGKIKILDFGIARITSAAEGRTRTGSFLGSPMYMSPEQIDDPKSVDHRCDIYSLGVTAWTLLANRKPYDDSSGSERKLLNQVAEQPLPPLQLADVGLEAWIRTCTEKDRNRRPASAADALKLLGSSKAGGEETVVVPKVVVAATAPRPAVTPAATPTPPQHTVTTDTGKGNGWVWMGLLVLGLAGFGLGRSAWLQHQQRLQQQAAQQRQQRYEDSLASRERFVQDSLERERLMAEKEQQRQDSLERAADPFEGSMVRVRGGTFQMGSNEGNPSEKPVHSVTVGDFWIGKFEVTQAQWRAVMGNNPSNFSGCDQCPVEQVSWNDVQGFLRKLKSQTGKNYRLPTEAEWEYAAGVGNGTRTKWAGTNVESRLGNYAWYWANGGSKTHPVGQKQSNGRGLYDMSGNVWEWCSDWYAEDYYAISPSANPKGPASGKYLVLRGGSWYVNDYDCRVAIRYYFNPSGWGSSNGFRLARD